MPEIFFAADHHFQHNKVLTFRNPDSGQFLRPQFGTIEEHDEHIIGRHNAVVGPNDKVFMLGDITWKTNARSKEILSRLNGVKELIGGNHDHIKFLYPYFSDVHVWKYMPEHNMILSHAPLSYEDMKRSGFNVHGHTHERSQTINLGGTSVLDPRYMCVSMEQIDYTPISLDMVEKVRASLAARFSEYVDKAKKQQEALNASGNIPA